MSQEIIINVTPREVRIALLENSVLQEVHIERSLYQGLLGNIYKGRVSRLLPGIQAAFIDIGLNRPGFLHISDVQGFEGHVDIRDLLRVGQDILVQVYKDPLGSKGARLTTQFTIPSRYLVLTPGTAQIAISQKITDEAERARLLGLLNADEDRGYIFRTVAEGVAQEEIDADKQFLEALWKTVKTRIKTATRGEIVYEEIPIVLRVLRDLVGYQIEKIRVDNAVIAQQMQEYAACYMPKVANRIEYYDLPRPIFDIYSIEDELQKILLRKVYLKSGSYIVFDQTEAMTTIDVNTGSFLGNNNLEQTILKTNLDAAETIARQLRLRNLGGIIIIDFIDMEDPAQKAELLKVFANALAKDNARTEISELTSLGLIQMTRKRTRESIEHILCVTCPTCQRRGFIKSFATISYEIIREIRRIAQIFPWNGFLVLASQSVIDCLTDAEGEMLAELKALLGKPIKLRVESSYTQEQYDILPLTEKE